ncbi:MAG: shikimate dehydrogenase [Rhodothermales bacterium]|nr:shikimate dehydrogenase [Rhodothermales bacterium]
MSIEPSTALFALIGDPVEHSLSPLIHNTAFEALSVDAAYAAFRVGRDRLADAVDGMAALGFLGANVTIPHKLAVMDLVDDVTETARAVGAVNTIRFEKTGNAIRVLGENTDAAGFAGPLPGDGAPAPRSALVLGAGGSSRAVIHACLRLVGIPDVAVTARRENQASEIADRFGGSAAGLRVVPWEKRASAAGEAELIVNCTPLGMHPATDGTPLEDVSGIGSDQVVYDLVYSPEETRLLKESSARGARTISGLEMLIGQAAAAFKWWTDLEMPIEQIRRAVRLRLAGS